MPAHPLGDTPKKQRGIRWVWRRFEGKVRGDGGDYGALSAGRDGMWEEEEQHDEGQGKRGF